MEVQLANWAIPAYAHASVLCSVASAIQSHVTPTRSSIAARAKEGSCFACRARCRRRRCNDCNGCTTVRLQRQIPNLVNGSLYTQMPQKEEDDTEVTLADRRTGKEPRLPNMRCHRRLKRTFT